MNFSSTALAVVARERVDYLRNNKIFKIQKNLHYECIFLTQGACHKKHNYVLNAPKSKTSRRKSQYSNISDDRHNLYRTGTRRLRF